MKNTFDSSFKKALAAAKKSPSRNDDRDQVVEQIRRDIAGYRAAAAHKGVREPWIVKKLESALADQEKHRSLAAKSSAIRLPTWSNKRGWEGGDSHRLYAFIDNLTGGVVVRPGGRSINGVGPNATVRPATRLEGEEHWQKPLHSGWKVTA